MGLEKQYANIRTVNPTWALVLNWFIFSRLDSQYLLGSCYLHKVWL